MPSIVQSIAFFTGEASGNHCRKTKYVVATVKKKGNLNRNRKIWTGR